MAKKKKDKLASKLAKLDKALYNTKKLTQEEILIHKMSKSLKRYYKRISPDRQRALISYILAKESEIDLDLVGLSMVEDDNDYEEVKPKKCKSLYDVLQDKERLKKKQKKSKKKKKYKDVIERNDGLLMLINREAYDHTLLSKKKYRKYLSKIASEEKGGTEIEIDCTLKGFKNEIMNNPNVNQAVSEAFFNKYGI